MDWSKFWEWGLWSYIGDFIVSQPFLTLMVPVATLTGVLITTRSNERIRRRELRAEELRWRYEVVKDNAALQRQAVLSSIREMSNLLERVEHKNRTYRHEYSGPLGNGYEIPPNVLSRLQTLQWLLSEVYVVVLTLELEISHPKVLARVEDLRDAVVTESDLITKLKTGRNAGSAANYAIDNYPQPHFIEPGISEIKKAAVQHLHPLPPKELMDQLPQDWC